MNNRYVLYTVLKIQHTLTAETTTIYIVGLWKHLNQRSKTIGVKAIRRLPTSLLHCHMIKFIKFFSSLHTPWNFVRTVPQWQLLGLWMQGGHYIMVVLRANRTNSITWRNEFWTLSRCSNDSSVPDDTGALFSGCEMCRKMFLPTDSSKCIKIADQWNMF